MHIYTHHFGMLSGVPRAMFGVEWEKQRCGRVRSVVDAERDALWRSLAAGPKGRTEAIMETGRGFARNLCRGDILLLLFFSLTPSEGAAKLRTM